MTVEDFVRAGLAYHFILLGTLYPIVVIARRARGRTPRAAPPIGPWRKAYRTVFTAIRPLIMVLVVARCIEPSIDRWLMPMTALQAPPVLLMGLSLLLISNAVAVFVLAYMGDEWRSDAVSHGQARLLTSGPFRLSRNPMYLGLAIGYAGFLLSLPSVFSAVIAAVGIVTLRLRIAHEEEYLKAIFGDEYRDYINHTARWLDLAALAGHLPRPRPVGG